MSETKLWSRDRFPIVYEGDEPKAVLVDVATFAQIELILDNLANREGEPEDKILAASKALQHLLQRALQETPVKDWRREIDEL